MSDLKIAGSSYIVSFFQEVQGLNHNFAVYSNNVLEINHKCNNEPEKIKNISDSEKAVLNQATQLIRIAIMKTYLAYKTISKNIKVNNDKLEELYKKLTEKYNFDSDVLQDYILEINNVLVSDIIQELIQNSQAFLNQIYNDSGRVQQ